MELQSAAASSNTRTTPDVPNLLVNVPSRPFHKLNARRQRMSEILTSHLVHKHLSSQMLQDNPPTPTPTSTSEQESCATTEQRVPAIIVDAEQPSSSGTSPSSSSSFRRAVAPQAASGGWSRVTPSQPLLGTNRKLSTSSTMRSLASSSPEATIDSQPTDGTSSASEVVDKLMQTRATNKSKANARLSRIVSQPLPTRYRVGKAATTTDAEPTCKPPATLSGASYITLPLFFQFAGASNAMDQVCVCVCVCSTKE
jgi:hypothetical protein